jgi:hypothetical protein
MRPKAYTPIIRFAESFLEKYGDNYLGVGWTKSQEDADTRYRVMLELMPASTHDNNISLLDFGCGASHLYDYILREKIPNIEYSGLDVSEKFLALSQAKFPSIKYYNVDILEEPHRLEAFDYIVMNGVLTTKCDLPFEEMWEYFTSLLGRVYEKARHGLAFNVMSKQVDWERNDLFHVSMDDIAGFLTANLARNFVIRHDYGLYEYTVYVYRRPRQCLS